MRLQSYILTILALWCVVPLTQGEPLGRLFSTPAERVKLDRARMRALQKPMAADQASQLEDDVPPIDEHVTVDGYVTRSSGKTTTWINQIAHDERERTKVVEVVQQPHHSPIIYVQTQSGKKVNIKVGDTLDTQSGAVKKVYEQDERVPMPMTTP